MAIGKAYRPPFPPLPVFDTQHLKIFSTDTPVGLQDHHRWYMDGVVCVCLILAFVKHLCALKKKKYMYH